MLFNVRTQQILRCFLPGMFYESCLQFWVKFLVIRSLKSLGFLWGRRVFLWVLSAFFIRASCTGLPHINLPVGTVVGLLQFQSFFLSWWSMQTLQSVTKSGRMSNLCFCALCREIKFYEIDILMPINLYACPLRSTFCSDWNKHQVEECCVRKRQISVLAGILCFRDANTLTPNSWTSSVLIKKKPKQQRQNQTVLTFSDLTNDTFN